MRISIDSTWLRMPRSAAIVGREDEIMVEEMGAKKAYSPMTKVAYETSVPP